MRWGGLRFRLQSKPVFISLTQLGLPYGKGKAEIVKIPEKIIEKGWKYTRYVIRGIFDTDGTLFFSKKAYSKPIYPTIEISTSSKGLAEQLESELTKHGFRVRKRQFHREGTDYLTEYRVALYGQRMVNLWFKKIGSSNRRHYEKFMRQKNLYTHN